jgi:hypothetical protein
LIGRRHCALGETRVTRILTREGDPEEDRKKITEMKMRLINDALKRKRKGD